MQNFLLCATVQYFLLLVGSMDVRVVDAFVESPRSTMLPLQPTSLHRSIQRTEAIDHKSRETTILFSSTSTKPLYDGTNYTFPDTQTPAGVAELLEVSFIHGCMQLASGYVDVLKMFIAVSISAYEAGFSIDSILEELEDKDTSINTANRPLMDEEKLLRRNWICVIYLTLSAMQYTPSASSLAVDVAIKSIPEDIKTRYGDLVTKIADAYKVNSRKALSVEDLMIGGGGGDENLNPVEKAVLLQSLKVATLTPVVVNEAQEARESTGNNPKNELKVPTPPIEGAF